MLMGAALLYPNRWIEAAASSGQFTSIGSGVWESRGSSHCPFRGNRWS